MYWSSGGDVLARGAAVQLADARALLGVHLDEARVAVAAGAGRTALRVLDLAAQLDVAIARCLAWRAAAGSRG